MQKAVENQFDLFTPREPAYPDGIPDEISRLFEKLAFEVSRAGHKRYSSDAILHRIRWHFTVDKGMRDFKCNDHWTAVLARWFLKKYPSMEGFFELRERRQKEE